MPARAIPQSSPTELNFDAQPATVSATGAPEKIRYKQPPMFSAIRKKDQMTFDNWQYAFLNLLRRDGTRHSDERDEVY